MIGVLPMQFDFFIAHAFGDRRMAEELGWELEDLGRDVFLDAADLSAGAEWDDTLATSLAQSRAVVVLVSTQTAKAHYQREEIARALNEMRTHADRRKVIPVLLPGAGAADMPYGLALIQHIDASSPGGMKRVARRLDAEIPTRTAESLNERRNAYYALGAALRLDRVKQWSLILEAAHVSENVLFLFHGPHDQNVGLFLERIQRFFSHELSNAYNICRVRFNIQGQTPRTGTDWLAHLRDALQCPGALAPRLRQMVQQRPLFIMLGQSPLPVDQLTDQHLDALREFIVDHLTTLLRDAQVDRGICVMLTLDYDKNDPDLIRRIARWGKEAEASKTLRFRPLPQASLPTWDEVNDYLISDVTPLPNAEQMALIRQEYDRHVKNPDLTFERLARLIDRYTLTS